MTRLMLVLLALLTLTVAACSASPESAETAPVELVIEANDFSFIPAVVEVKVGQPVRLTLNNAGFLEHDWSISHIHVTNVREHSAHSAGHGAQMQAVEDDPDLHVAAMAGESGAVEFTPIEPGEYKIVCNVPGHEEAGMVGTLIVREE